MKCIKWLTGLYAGLIVTIASGIVVACTAGKDNIFQGYVFDSSVPDTIPELNADSVNSLFKNGVTLRRFEGTTYAIINTSDQNIADTIYKAIDWGPITLDRTIDQSPNDFFKLNITPIGNDEVKVSLTVDLISRFKGTITKINFIPSWISYSINTGFVRVETLHNIEINFPDGLNENEVLSLPINWESHKNLVKGNPMLLSVRVEVTTDKGNFIEVMSLAVDNHFVK